MQTQIIEHKIIFTVGNTATTTIGGKQILLQKPISLSGQNVLQLVKTSQGMAVQSLPKVNVMQKAGTSTINTANIQQQIMSGAQIVTAGGAGNQGAKTALIGTNVVKLVSPSSVGGNKIQIVSGAQIMKTGGATNQVQGMLILLLIELVSKWESDKNTFRNLRKIVNIINKNNHLN